MYRGTPEEDEELERERRDHGKWKSYFMKYHRTKRNWDTGKYSLATLTHHKNTVRCVQFDENYNMITARYTTALRVSCVLYVCVVCVVRTVTDAGSRWFVWCSDDKTVQRLDWDADKGAYVPKMKLTGHEGGIICMQFDGTTTHTPTERDTPHAEPSRTRLCLTPALLTFLSLSLSPPVLGNQMITGSRDKTLRLWDLEKGKTISTFKNHTGQVWCLQVFFTPLPLSFVYLALFGPCADSTCSAPTTHTHCSSTSTRSCRGVTTSG
jgi:WD40 repeat protein